jgi:hypothetical protein
MTLQKKWPSESVVASGRRQLSRPRPGVARAQAAWLSVPRCDPGAGDRDSCLTATVTGQPEVAAAEGRAARPAVAGIIIMMY